MSIQISTDDGRRIYRQREDDPCVLESRSAVRGSRWMFLLRYATAEEARRALLHPFRAWIGKGEEDARDAAIAKEISDAVDRGERETVPWEEVKAELRKKGKL